MPGYALVAQLAKPDMLVLDDHGLKPTLMTSQLPITNWHKVIGDVTRADAILDRLLHNNHKPKLIGETKSD